MRVGGKHSARLSRFKKRLDQIRAASGIAVRFHQKSLNRGTLYLAACEAIMCTKINGQRLLESFDTL